nr:hypothetical protein [Acetobacter senegalensis]
MVSHTGYGVPSTMKATSSTKSCRPAGTRRPQRHLLTRLLKTAGARPKRMVTDKLASYGAARRKVKLPVRHFSRKGLNKWAENAHLPL